MVETSSLFSVANTDAKKVWVSLITTLKYLPGILTLDFSLKKAGSHYPLVAIYTDTFPEEGRRALQARGIPMQHVRYLKPTVHKDYSNDPRFYDCWTKLACFSLTQYQRVALLDSDMVVLRNMDELMELPLDPPGYGGKGKRVFAASHACICNPVKKAHYPKNWTHDNCAFTTQESDPITAQTQGPATDAGIGMVNGGLLVLEPSVGAFQAIVDKLQEPDAIASYEFPDQALVSDVFKDRWVPIPYIYNALKTMRANNVHGSFWRDDKIKNLHLLLSPKPWQEKPGVVTNELHEWWKEYNRQRLASEEEKGINDGH